MNFCNSTSGIIAIAQPSEIKNSNIDWNYYATIHLEEYVGIGYYEIYSNDLFSYVKNTSYYPTEYYSFEHNKNEIKLKSYGKYFLNFVCFRSKLLYFHKNLEGKALNISTLFNRIHSEFYRIVTMKK